MKYTDGVVLNAQMRVVECPRCYNEEFGEDALFCRICGLMAYNRCAGKMGQYDEPYDQHDCPGNARYCEICGAETSFYRAEILKPWEAVQEILFAKKSDGVDYTDMDAGASVTLQKPAAQVLGQDEEIDDDDLPF